MNPLPEIEEFEIADRIEEIMTIVGAGHSIRVTRLGEWVASFVPPEDADSAR